MVCHYLDLGYFITQESFQLGEIVREEGKMPSPTWSHPKPDPVPADFKNFFTHSCCLNIEKANRVWGM